MKWRLMAATLCILSLLLIPVMVSADSPMAERTAPTQPLVRQPFDVTIETGDYGVAAVVLEYLQSGLSYVDSSVDDCQVICPGPRCQEFMQLLGLEKTSGTLLAFILIGEREVTYRVQADSPGVHQIAGKLTDWELVSHKIAGTQYVRASGEAMNIVWALRR